MLKQLKTRKSEGFTIIEVLIVLAIAGLILLVVLLAVPALQRNARNTTIKNDASALAGGFSEYVSNNDGKAPASPLAQNGANVTIGATGTSQATAKVSGSTTVNVAKATPTTFAAGQLWWNTGKTCDGTANSRAIAVYYYIEVSGTPSNTPKCVDAA
ncbi:MAG TPA: prepilin-type N-terminal cleavage/methylation domain-containing protein [Candidatus Saccharimonadales bacterium]|nr:prepilin-type N-terminal cleavage/methylation domain-containing protein [Candidatus Saccharimonadales bacterium]